MIWATGNLSVYKLVDLSRCKFLIVLTPFLKGLGWVAEAGSGKTRLKGTVHVSGGCGQHLGNSGGCLERSQRQQDKCGRRRGWIWDIKCATVSSCWDAPQKREKSRTT